MNTRRDGMTRTGLAARRLARAKRNLQRKQERNRAIVWYLVIITIFSVAFLKWTAPKEVPITDVNSKCIFVLTSDGMTHKIYVDNGYKYHVGDTVTVNMTYFTDPEDRVVWLVDDMKGGECNANK